MGVDIVREFPDTTWASDGPTRGVEAIVEDGKVLSFPHLPFVLTEAERKYLDPQWADGRAKNISVRWPSGELRGAAAASADLDALRALIVRYAEQAEALVLRLFPHYQRPSRARQFVVPAVPGRDPRDELAQGRHAAPHRRVSVQSDARHAPAARLQQRQSERPAARVARRRAVRGPRPALPAGDPSTAARHRVPAACQRHHEAPTHRVRSCDAATA